MSAGKRFSRNARTSLRNRITLDRGMVVSRENRVVSMPQA